MNTEEKVNSKKRWIILFSVVIVTFMATLDASIVNVALPVISHDLRVPMESVQWAITTYLIVISGLILTFGRLGDIIGKTKVFRIGIIIFTIGSLLCGLSHTITLLIISRGIQGLGAACTMANSQGIITATFGPENRGKALGISGLVVALGTMTGPALGGIISEFKWEYIFLINIPIGIFATILAFKVLPSNRVVSENRPKLDIVGTILFLIAIVALVLAITEGSVYGYTNKNILLSFLIAVIAFIIFMITQVKFKSPVLNIKIFKNHRFTKGVLASFLIFTAISSYSILIPFYYEEVRRISPGMSGLLMMVFPIALSISSPLAGSLSDKMRREILPFIGLIICGIGFLLLSTLKVDTSIWLVILYLFIMGAGNGFFQAPMNAIVMSSVDKTQLGIAGSMNGLVRNLGMVCGITFGTSLLYDLMSNKLGYVVKGFIPGQGKIFVGSMDMVILIGSIICFIGVLIVLSIILKINKERKAAK
ncbi:MFS transporter [uncultured Clostridium sp.]|uniref:MFS transporter n=1 Tax=uncultured Clostridium sp. TaxID=59620 RepID=UPI0026065182|nr:MFS transporter [uncultured Clostridium sp.]